MAANRKLLTELMSLNPQRIGEINLLLEALADIPRDTSVVYRMISQMAAKTDHMPQPELCISIGKQLNIIQENEGKSALTNLGRMLLKTAKWPPHDRFNEIQLNIIAPEILGHPDLNDYIVDALNSMSTTQDLQRIFQLGLSRLPDEQGLAFQLLQALGFAIAETDCISIAKEKFSILSSLLSGLTTKSENELWQSITATNRRARAAEEYVVEYEQRRLSAAGRRYLSDLVERVSEHDVLACFDVRSFELDGATRYIEVKSSTSLHVRFFWSIQERNFAQRHAESYWIYFVPRAQDLPDLKHDLVLIRDPVACCGHHLHEEPYTFRVCLIRDINELQAVGDGDMSAKILTAL